MQEQKEVLIFPASGENFMCHSVKREGEKIRMNGWVNPNLKPSVGDLIQGTFMDGNKITIKIEQIEFCNHPGIFGKYEMKTFQDSDKKTELN